MLFNVAGHSLPSLVATFVKKRLNLRTNRWPIRLLNAGASYRDPKSLPGTSVSLYNSSQSLKVGVLCFCRSEEEEYSEYQRLINIIHPAIAEDLQLRVKSTQLEAHKLLNYESAATSLSSHADIEVWISVLSARQVDLSWRGS